MFQILHNHRKAFNLEDVNSYGRCLGVQVVLHYLRNVLVGVFLRSGWHNPFRNGQAWRADWTASEFWNSNYGCSDVVQDCYGRRLEQNYARLHDPAAILHSRAEFLGNRLRQLFCELDLFLHLLRHHHVHRIESSCRWEIMERSLVVLSANCLLSPQLLSWRTLVCSTPMKKTRCFRMQTFETSKTPGTSSTFTNAEWSPSEESNSSWGCWRDDWKLTHKRIDCCSSTCAMSLTSCTTEKTLHSMMS